MIMWPMVSGLIRNSFTDMHIKESRIANPSMMEPRRGLTDEIMVKKERKQERKKQGRKERSRRKEGKDVKRGVVAAMEVEELQESRRGRAKERKNSGRISVRRKEIILRMGAGGCSRKEGGDESYRKIGTLKP
jgi:hypothetical protein